MQTIQVQRRKTTVTIPVTLPEHGAPLLIAGEEFLTTRQAAKLLHLQPETISRYIRSGKLPASLVGRKFLIRRCAVIGLVDDNAVQ
jgi:excisionase family DNA binding protein